MPVLAQSQLHQLPGYHTPCNMRNSHSGVA